MPERGGPLSGIRVVDFTWAWAGPKGTLLLAILGAEVIKVESRARLDHARVHSLTAGNITGGIDESPIFNDLNLGKHSVTLNLKKGESRDLVRRLVTKSDVVVQNMRPGVLDKMGLGYEDLRELKPAIIMLSSSAVGATGPERSYTGYAPTFAALSGIADISGHPDEPPQLLGGSVDLRVGTASAFAVLAALIHRRRTGQGQHIDLSSTEVMSSMMGDAFVGYGLNGRLPQRMGNRDEAMAPHGCYRCRGEGEWITIAVESDSEWQSLASLLDDPGLEDEDLAGAEQRWRHQDRIDAAIERWTGQRSSEEAARILQRAGVAAAPVQSGAVLAADAHVEERAVFETVRHPTMGETKVVGPPWRMEGAHLRGAAPLLGQHNDYVLGEVLGLDPGEIERLESADVVY